MSRIENFKSEQELIGRIEQLRADGVSDDDITVFSKEKLEGTSLNYTNVNFKSADGTAWDKFVSFFTSEAPEERAMADLGLSEENQQEYVTALQAGDILLFVSKEAQGASTENLGEDEADTSNNQSDDDAVGGESHNAGFTQEEKDPGLPGTDRKEAISSTDAVGGSTLSADAKGHGHIGLSGGKQSVEEGIARDIERDTQQPDINPANVNERGDVRDEEVNVDERGISNRPGTNSDGSTRQDKDVSGYGHDSDSSGRTKRLKPNETYVAGAGGGGDAARSAGSDAKITEVEPNQTYGTGEMDKQDEDYEGTLRAGGDGDDAARAAGSDAKIIEVEPNQTYGADEADRQDADYEGTMRAGAYDGENEDDEDIIRDEDIERDARVVDEEPFEEYVTNETAERIDVSTYGYNDTANRDDIETSSDGGNALKDEDLTRDDRAIRNKYKTQEVRESEFTEHDPDRRNFNTD